MLEVQPHSWNQQILTKHFRYHLILVSVLREETTAYPFPTQLVVSSSINSQLLQSFSHVLQHAAWTVCLEPLSGPPSPESSEHSLPQWPPQNFGIFVFPVGIHLEIKQHAMYYSFKNSRFPLKTRIRFLQTFHFQNNSMPISSTITERTTPQRTRPIAQKGKGSIGKAKKRQKGNY